MTIPTRQHILSILLLFAITTRPALGQSPLRGISFPELIESFVTRTYDPENPSESCYDVLYASDENGDGILQNYEYTTFIAELSEGDFDQESYIDLPFTLKVNFVYLSCMCQFFPGSTDGGCCEGPNGGINVTSANPNNGLDLGGTDNVYLNTVCSETQGAIEFARNDAGISRSPTGSPTAPTTSPTLEPSAGPTVEPTVEPTVVPGSPTVEPTLEPSAEPSAGPTKSPTPSPSMGPTPSPSMGPTPSPSADPTKRPTPSPSMGPTPTPSADPTKSPTPSPSMGPTPSPSADPMKSPTPSPSMGPTPTPSTDPTESPTDPPSKSPSEQPTQSPTTSAPTPSPTLAPSTAAPTGSPTPTPVTDTPSTAPPTGSPTRITPIPTTPIPVIDDPTGQPSTNAPISGTGAPTVAPSTNAPISGTGAPTVEPSTKAPIIGTGAPTVTPTTKAPTIGTGAPTVTPTTEAPIIGTGAPTVTPSTKAPIIGTGAPTTTKPTFVQVPTTKAPTPGGTSYPSVSSRPSLDRGGIFIPIPSPTNKPNENTDSVEKPDGDRAVEDPESETLTTGQVVGIALAAAFVAYAAAYVLVTRRKRKRDDDPELEEVRNKDLDDLEAGNAVGMGDDDGGHPNKKPGITEITGDDDRYKKKGGGSSGPSSSDGAGFSSDSDVAVDGAGFSSDSDVAVYDGEPYDNPDYISGSSDATPRSPSSSHDIALITGLPISPKKRSKESDSSSAASESGWSSSAGMSSLNTASFDDRTDDGLLPGTPDRFLAAIGVADTVTHMANLTQRDSKPSFIPVDDQNDSTSSIESTQGSKATGASPLRIHSKRPQQGKVSREDLNSAIEAGDWAMVGATAALLADSTASDHSLSGSEVHGDTSSSFVSSSSVSATSDSAHRAKELDQMVVSGDWEGVVLAAAQFEGGSGHHDEDTMGSESMSMSMRTEGSVKKAEVRAEVEQLVRRVVPDEVENIDEMMIQFEGREEELIETLRTMQERNVAQRARAAVQKTAKLEARAKASIASSSSATSSGNYPLRKVHSNSMSSEPSHYGSSINSSMSDYTGGSATSSVSDLEMNSDDHSSSRMTTQSSLGLAIERGDWRAVGEAAAMMGGSSGIIPDSPGGSFSSGVSESVGKSERVYQLDALIAKGDWAGIVAAAGNYQAMDDQTEPSPPMEEEREALAQAKMWQTIANQSRQDSGAEAKGAVDAADWAISRSLEQKMKGTVGAAASGSDPDPRKPRIADDESV